MPAKKIRFAGRMAVILSLLPALALGQEAGQVQQAPPAAGSTNTSQPPASQTQLPNAPSPTAPQEPSLSDLGFTPEQTKADPALQDG